MPANDNRCPSVLGLAFAKTFRKLAAETGDLGWALEAQRAERGITGLPPDDDAPDESHLVEPTPADPYDDPDYCPEQ